ncbi:MAG TPA: hypothetical protein H9878_04260 [Candidatus Dietzia merdigallinarum]|nr:hypothetical protein [Candidatus Dietzia merdigallinarum]
MSATFGMNSSVVAQSVPKPHRDQTEEILAALVAEGVATVDSAGKYLKNNEESA